MAKAISNSTTSNLKGKRKKKSPTNANPLFTQWLTEWKDEAMEKGWKSAHTYSKALKTLKLFPLRLETGSDCRLLQNFGEKICQMLDEKLLEYKKNQGNSQQPMLHSLSGSEEEITLPTAGYKNSKPGKKRCQKKVPKELDGLTKLASSCVDNPVGNEEPKCLNNNSATPANFGSGEMNLCAASLDRMSHKFHDISDSSDCDTDSRPVPPKKLVRRSNSQSREYVPAYRSGPYALILTLYRHHQDPLFKGYMTKTELSQSAQPLADKSFTKPNPGSHYTAWSSCGTLLKKGFIQRTSSPARYSLTATGIVLGEQLNRAEESHGVNQEGNEAAVDLVMIDPTVSTLSSKENVDLDDVIISSDESLSPKKFLKSIDETSSKVPPVQGEYELKMKRQQLNHPQPPGVEDVVEISDESDTDCKMKGEKVLKTNFNDSYDELPDLDLPLSERLLQRGNIKSSLITKHQTDLCSVQPPLLNSALLSNPSGICPVLPLSVNQGSESEKKGSFLSVNNIKHDPPLVKPPRPATNAPSNHKKNATSAEIKHLPSNLQSAPVSVSTSQYSTPCPEFSLQPGTFDIILCCDNREFFGSKSNSKTLLPDLMKSGVQCDLRLLHVGDLLWIARERVAPNIDREQGRELVLNYVIERKRMDDLVSSITNGRMKEQKFRLKHCGLSEAIILIEEYGPIQNFSLPEERIKQSIVNSQIIDGFKVRFCSGPSAVVTYLSTMTRFLQQHYSTKTLHAVPIDAAKEMKGQQHIQNKEQFLIQFHDFNQASMKHKDLTVKEMFGRQLIQVPGISAERARAITNVYPTLSTLLEAYEKCKDSKEKEKLLAGIKTGKKERNLGASLSKMLFLLYTQEGKLS